MITNAEAFKSLIETLGKQIDVAITHGTTTYNSEKIVSCSITTEGSLLTSVMKQAEIELDGIGGSDVAESLKNEKIGITITVSAGGESATRDFGTFVVKDAEYSDDYNSVKLTCYDLLLYAMQPYTPFIDFSQGVTLGSYLEQIAATLNIPLATTAFTNSAVLVDEEKYDRQYTFRDVLTEIAQVAGGTIAIKNDELAVLYPTETGITITPDNLKSITVGEPYGAVNSVVLARTPQEDNIYKTDDGADEIIEIRIENNQIADSHRDDFINGIYGALHGLAYYPCEISSFGMCFFDVCDRYKIETLDGTQYSTIYLGGALEITRGITETAKVEVPKGSETDYNAASTTDRKVNQTILRVNKQEQTISALVSTTTNRINELDGKTEQLTQKVEATMTAENIKLEITKAIAGINEITTATGYTFDADGLRISKENEEIENLLDNTGMYVNRNEDNILTANAEGVNAINLTARQYLTIGKNSRFEDFETNRTACFWIGG